MRRAVLWIIVIMTTFVIGVGIDRAVQKFSNGLPAPVEAKPIAIYFPEPESETAETGTPMTPTGPAKPNLILDYDQEKFDPAGYLAIMGPVPQDFKDFEWIELGVDKGQNDEYPATISVRSSGKHEDGLEEARADFALVTERTLYFTTSPSDREGFQYRFEGEFLIKDFDSADGNTPAVRGKLTKSKNGRTIAEHIVTFSFFVGC